MMNLTTRKWEGKMNNKLTKIEIIFFIMGVLFFAFSILSSFAILPVNNETNSTDCNLINDNSLLGILVKSSCLYGLKGIFFYFILILLAIIFIDLLIKSTKKIKNKK